MQGGNLIWDVADEFSDLSLVAFGVILNLVDLVFNFGNRFDSFADDEMVTICAKTVCLIHVKPCAVAEDVVEEGRANGPFIRKIYIHIAVPCEPAPHAYSFLKKVLAARH